MKPSNHSHTHRGRQVVSLTLCTRGREPVSCRCRSALPLSDRRYHSVHFFLSVLLSTTQFSLVRLMVLVCMVARSSENNMLLLLLLLVCVRVCVYASLPLLCSQQAKCVKAEIRVM